MVDFRRIALTLRRRGTTDIRSASPAERQRCDTSAAMFVLPPPPRYPTQAAYNAAVGAGHVAPMIETNNILSNPSGPEYQFLAGEGLYILKEDLHLATPPPHPSEAPVVNPNPLATTPQPATAGTKLSLDAAKRKKPKNNMNKSNSSFISRVITHETLNRRLQERLHDGMFAFANINRAFQWLDLSSPTKADYLTKILFTKAHCLCHDVNRLSKSPTHVDVIMGFSTGEIIWWEPISQRYTRLNKNGIINGTPVSEIRWIPGSETFFLAAHMDGTLVVYDKEREDALYTPGEEAHARYDGEVNGANGWNNPTRIHVEKSIHSKNHKTNPVAVWKLSNQRINAFAFSPDRRHLAVVSEDGSLRIIDYLKEELLDLFYSYYGGLICVCWSPDGKYVLTGGQDDLISICVGEDCRICLWDFSVGMLHRPKAASVRQQGSTSSRLTTLARAETQNTSFSRLRSDSNLSSADGVEEKMLPHPVEPRARTAMLPAVLSKIIDPDPLAWLDFTEDAIITSCNSGHIRTWNRPSDSMTDLEKKDGT
ncbi:hypothetical protein P8C59_008842 [Phyllachora maydis]|uniref:Catabolite repression protein creC n=1 Tax=Phyllachora maydis TaxID=1825666 RepID=A0AAD9IC92_9PEZI|nr:hypothetical protein P8C59_008842 [Phyllachora maydis]